MGFLDTELSSVSTETESNMGLEDLHILERHLGDLVYDIESDTYSGMKAYGILRVLRQTLAYYHGVEHRDSFVTDLIRAAGALFDTIGYRINIPETSLPGLVSFLQEECDTVEELIIKRMKALIDSIELIAEDPDTDDTIDYLEEVLKPLTIREDAVKVDVMSVNKLKAFIDDADTSNILTVLPVDIKLIESILDKGLVEDSINLSKTDMVKKLSKLPTSDSSSSSNTALDNIVVHYNPSIQHMKKVNGNYIFSSTYYDPTVDEYEMMSLSLISRQLLNQTIELDSIVRPLALVAELLEHRLDTGLEETILALRATGHIARNILFSLEAYEYLVKSTIKGAADVEK